MGTSEVQMARARMIPLWVKVVVVLSAALSAMGAVIAFVQPGMLLEPHAEITSGVRIYAGYLTSRNLVLAVMLLVLLMAGARRALGNLLAVVGLIQIADCAVDCLEARWMVAPGVLVLGVVFLFAASRICGPFWRKESWM